MPKLEATAATAAAATRRSEARTSPLPHQETGRPGIGFGERIGAISASAAPVKKGLTPGEPAVVVDVIRGVARIEGTVPFTCPAQWQRPRFKARGACRK